MKLIDVSHWQGNINFNKVKASGIDGVIIKAGGSDAGFYKDSKFDTNYANAIAAGLYVGAYYFVGAKCTSLAAGKEDAKRFIEIIKGKKFDLPVYMDVEAPARGQKDAVTNAIFGFCETMEANKYYVGVYGSDLSGFRDRFNYGKLKGRFTLWVARYGSKPSYVTSYDIWQYSSSGKVPGISGNVDMDECYKDFPAIIRNSGLNGYSKSSKPEPVKPTPTPANPIDTKSVDELAKEVIAGKYGDGDVRKKALGARYNEVQKRVNELLSKPKTAYYPAPKYTGISLVDALRKIGVDPSFANRKAIAIKNGISNYSGTALQNLKLVSLLKQGKLKK